MISTQLAVLVGSCQLTTASPIDGLNDAQLGYRRQRDKYECSGHDCRKLTASRPSRMTANDSIDDHAASRALDAPPWRKRRLAWQVAEASFFRRGSASLPQTQNG
jgi:hypothetical protein